MKIREMFVEDINRKINGVVQVNQDKDTALEQELNEYIITKELKKHFTEFFKYYARSLDTPTDDIGVWISGFFGSGKSHFLKMLSYLLADREVNGVRTSERFEKKYKEESMDFSDVAKSLKTPAETILFNIDVEGSINKNSTSVMRIFAKMFYNHIGFYGDNLNVVQLEKHLKKQGKFQDFMEEFKKINGNSWIESRKSYSFFEDHIVDVMKKVLNMSETAARNWFVSDITNSDANMEISIGNLVADMKEYVDTKPEDFRLVFMIDEIGQYIGTDTGMLLNLQSLVEEIGSKCGGKVWVICTGQEAIDEIFKKRADEFSRIQARFKTRLSLSSSSADEVIQKRVLKKTPKATRVLQEIYDKESYVMSNLFNFKNGSKNIKGFKNLKEFVVNFPFVPYEFKLMQKVFREIRKSGNAGKHLSGGERSMLSAFQEAAQSIQDRDDFAIVPFFMFYDTVHSFLDSNIREVIERCEKDAENCCGIEKSDVDLLKLLFLLRYIDDVPATIENVVIFMADSISVDKLIVTERIQRALSRLIAGNYIARTGEIYSFLTLDEQEVEREIQEESVAPDEVIKRISEIIFEKIYTRKKLNYEDRYEFEFDREVDGLSVGRAKGGMKLEVVTVATGEQEKTPLKLMSRNKQGAIVALPSDESGYYEYLENSLKIAKFSRKKNLSQVSEVVKSIIKEKQENGKQYEEDAVLKLKNSLVKADFYIAGEKINIVGNTPQAKINEALRQLVLVVYQFLDMIDKNIDSDSEILNILSKSKNEKDESAVNKKAADEMERYLQMQNRQGVATPLEEIYKRYGRPPYGWREKDIAYVVAMLIGQQKVNFIYGDEIIEDDSERIVNLILKKSEIKKIHIKIKESISARSLKGIRGFLREYFDVMDVPENERGVAHFIISRFKGIQTHYKELLERYTGHNYPDRDILLEGVDTIGEILKFSGDSVGIISKVLELVDELEDLKEDSEDIEEFFRVQVGIFDEAVAFEEMMSYDMDYFIGNDKIRESMEKIREIVVENPKRKNAFRYRDIPGLNLFMNSIKEEHLHLLEEKRKEVLEVIKTSYCELEKIETSYADVRHRIEFAIKFLENKKEEVKSTTTLAILDSFIQRVVRITKESIEFAEKSKERASMKYVVYDESSPSKILKSKKDIAAYLKELKKELEKAVEENGEVEI